jgi:hypothetical protein
MPTVKSQKDTASVFFHFDRVFSGGLQLCKGDKVTFHLRRQGSSSKKQQHEKKKHQSPPAQRVSVVKLSSRPMGVFVDFLSTFVCNLHEEQHSTLNQAIECPEVWIAMRETQSKCGDNVLRTKMAEQLHLAIRHLTRSTDAQATTVLENIISSGFLEPPDGCMYSSIQNVDSLTDEVELCVAMFRRVSQFRSRLIPYVQVLALATQRDEPVLPFLMDLLKAATVTAGDIACLSWADLPMIITAKEFEMDTPSLGNVLAKGAYSDRQSYFDVYFRLLREDCFAPMRECVQKWRQGILDPRDMQVYTQVRVKSMGIPDEQSAAGGTLLTLYNQGFKTQTDGSLMFGSLIAISPRNGDIRKPVWATICQRQQDATCELQVELCTKLNGLSDPAAIDTLVGSSCIVAVSPSFYRAYEPALQALQKMDNAEMPFEEELVHSGHSHGFGLCERAQEYAVGGRLNAIDQGGKWYNGTIVEVSVDGRIQVHFDRFATKWDEWYDPILDASKLRAVDIDTPTVDASYIYDDLKRIPLDQLLHRLAGDMKGDHTTFDASQLEAVEHVLSNRLAIVQGPPGTGKTFIGIKLTQLLLSMQDSEGKPIVNAPILVLTYKNHALDDFLTGCLKPEVAGPDHVARIGGRSVEGSPLYNCNIRSILRSKSAKRRSDTHQKIVTRITGFREALMECKVFMNTAARAVVSSRTFSLATMLQDEKFRRQVESLVRDAPESIFLRGATKFKRKRDEVLTDLQDGGIDSDDAKSSVVIAEHLLGSWLNNCDRLTEAVDMTAANSVLVSTETEKMELKNDEEAERLASANLLGDKEQNYKRPMIEFETVGVSKCKVEVAENESAIIANVTNIWSLRGDQKAVLVQCMLLQRHKDAASAYEQVQAQYISACQNLQKARESEWVYILSKKKVLGVTITGASIHHSVLQKLSPSVVIVEEAAEILEPQLLASLGTHVQQLIMIGDHKQLRPSVQCHKLVKDHNFDISMMERLVNNKHPSAMLRFQGRMRPEIALMMKDIYPELETNRMVVTESSRPRPLCVASSMFFWDHRDPEVGARSYSNPKEADRVVKLALWFVQQGYSPSEVTVLAAYSGQEQVLRDGLHKEFANHPTVWVNELSNKQHTERIHEIDFITACKDLPNKDEIAASKYHELGMLLVARGKDNDIDLANKYFKLGLTLSIESVSSAISARIETSLSNVKTLKVGVSQFSKSMENLDQLNAFKAACQDFFRLGRQFQVDAQPEFAQCAFQLCAQWCTRFSADIRRSSSDHEQAIKELEATKIQSVSALQSLRRDQNEIQVHSIDRFQGAENSIVIISLVRSNEKNIVGYLSAMNRRCVAQSRARCGLYFVGNAELLSSHATWRSFLQKLAEQGNLGSHITLQCPDHPAVSILQAETADEIDLKAGICQEKCLRPMALCDHLCNKTCHLSTQTHFFCAQKVCMQQKCTHYVIEQCSRSSIPIDKCGMCIEEYRAEKDQQHAMDLIRVDFERQKAAIRREAKHQKSEEELLRKERNVSESIERQKATQRIKRAKHLQQQLEEEQRHKATLEAIEDETKRNIRRLRSSVVNGGHVFKREDLQATRDGSEYCQVLDQTERFAQADHNIPMQVRRIEKVTNTKLEEAWYESQLNMVGKDGATKFLFHGTSVEGVNGITANGFRLPERNEDNMFGSGVYFATDSTKSAQELYTKDSKMLLLCEVRIGKSCCVEGLALTAPKHPLSVHVKTSSRRRRYLDVHLPKVRKARFDSVFAKRGTREQGGVVFDEYIVYDPRCAFPRYIVHFGGGASSRPARHLPPAGVQKHELKPQGKNVAANLDPFLLSHFNAAVTQFHQMLPLAKVCNTDL